MLRSTSLRPAVRAILAVATVSAGALALPGAGPATAAHTTSVTQQAVVPSDYARSLAVQEIAARQAARAERRQLARQHRREVRRQHRRELRQHRRAERRRQLELIRHRGERAFDVALDQQGDPYVWGATGPNAFDCSGLTSYAYERVGVDLPRTAAQQSGAVRRISHSQMRRGDLVFFSSGGHVYHVGLYAGRRHGTDYILHAPRPGEDVRTVPIWTGSWFGGTLR
jgi:cell wall-associated NlpC family hydrolase